MARRLNFVHLASQLFNRPLMVTPEVARTYVAVLAERFGVTGLSEVLADGTEVEYDAKALAGIQASALAQPPRPEEVAEVHDGVMIVPVRGTLTNRNGLQPYSGMTGYDGLRTKFAAAWDPSIRGVLLDVDSPGGAVDGCFDTADQLADLAQEKPVWCACTDMAYSAAYALASQCGRIYLPRTGGAGSVGVVMMHVDMSARMEMEGFKPTLIHAGAHKVDGNPYAPLPDDVRDEFQAEVETIRRLFVDLVATGRGLSADAVLATEARCFTGQAAIDVGFADAIGPVEDAMVDLIEFLDRGQVALPGPARSAIGPAQSATADMEEKTMAKMTRAAMKRRAKSLRAELARLDAAAEGEDEDEDMEGDEPEEDAAAEEDGDDEDEAAEEEDGDDEEEMEEEDETEAKALARAGKILNLDAAKGREALARKLATTPGMTVRKAKDLLEAAPKASASASIYEAHAATGGNPAIGPDGGDREMRSGDDKVASRIVGNYRKAGGQIRQ